MEREKLKVGKIHWIDFSAAAAVTLLACACLSVKSSAQDPGQKTFSSPEEASDSLVKAAQSNDEKTLIEILGREAKEIVSSGDHAEDSENRANFVKRYDQMHRLVREPDGTVSLYIGAENWPTPIPLVRKGSAWYFDTEAAKTEILFRRVGRNEMSTIRVCEELVASQKEYYASHQKEYALKSVSDQGQKDGLYWEAMNGEPQSPIGPLLAAAITADSSGNRAGTQTPFHGYYFRILTRQGKNAPGGAKNYVTNGKLTGVSRSWPTPRNTAHQAL